MNEVIGNILSRRSVREYSDRPLSEDDIELLVKAALYAPSGRNLQTWRLTVVQNRELIEEVGRATGRDRGDESFRPFFNAGTVIFVSGDESSEWMREDCAAATENLMLAAQSLGIGSCWIGCIRKTLQGEQVGHWRERLCVPDGCIPMYAVALGYFKDGFEAPSAPERKPDAVNYIR